MVRQAKQVLIIAHAPSRNTRQMLHALINGAKKNNRGDIAVTSITAFNANAEHILAAHAVILLTPENFAYMSGAMKDFFDRNYYLCLHKTDALPCAVVIRAGNDGHGTQRALSSIIRGLRWKQVQPALICQGDFTQGFISQCEELGEFMSAGLSAGII